MKKKELTACYLVDVRSKWDGWEKSTKRSALMKLMDDVANYVEVDKDMTLEFRVEETGFHATVSDHVGFKADAILYFGRKGER